MYGLVYTLAVSKVEPPSTEGVLSLEVLRLVSRGRVTCVTTYATKHRQLDLIAADTYRLVTSVNLHVEDVRLDGTTRRL